jgi:ATP-binding cassette subfamily B protein
VLDEATSALDSVTEAAIQASLEELSAGRTGIIVAHRLSTVRDADRIAVIENERVAEYGTHEELLEKNGLYARLWQTQKLS